MRSLGSQRQEKDFSAFEFDEDTCPEAASEIWKTTYSRRKARNSEEQQEDPAIKYEFLQAFMPGQTIKQTDAIAMSSVDLCGNASPQDSPTVNSPERNLAFTDEKSEMDENMIPSSFEGRNGICVLNHGTLVRIDTLMTGAASHVVSSVGNEQASEHRSDGTPMDVTSDDEESCKSGSASSSSSSASDLPYGEGYLEFQDSENCYTASGEKDNNDLGVVVSPDYVIYGHTLFGEAKLILGSDSIMVRCSETFGSDENFEREWAAADIVCIECQWSGSVNAALVKFHLRATTPNGNEKLHDTSDVEQLIIAVADINWLENELKSKSMAERYKGIWNVLHDDDLALEHRGAEHNSFFPRHYFTEISDSFEDVIYPKGDPDAVSISRRDIELLQPDTFINDTIIDFYIKYLKTKIPVAKRERYHFFNSFFFRKLADLDKDPGSASEGRAAFLRVRKWTRKVNVFEKDYIFIPVNFNLHWSLLVICHPGEVTSLKEDDVKDSSKVPCILHMDSIKGSHNGLKNLVQSYLLEEWKERHSESADDYTSMFSNMRFVPLELPQQENSFDCGLFLLHYVELFLDDAPVSFNPFKIREFSTFLTVGWFIPSEASFKRSFIRKLIYDLLNDPTQDVGPTFCSSDQLSTCNEHDIEQKPVIGLFNEQSLAPKYALDNSTSVIDRGTETNHATSLTAVELEKKESIAKYEVATSTPCLELHNHSSPNNLPFHKLRCANSPDKKHAYRTEPFISLSLDKDDSMMVDGSQVTKLCSPSHCPKEAGDYEMPWSGMQDKEEICMDLLDKSSDMVSDKGNEMGKQFSPCVEVCGFVPDSPASSSDENVEGVAEDPQQSISSKEEDDRKCDESHVVLVGESCKIPQLIEDLTEQNDADIKCKVPSAAVAAVRDKDDHPQSERIEGKGENSDNHHTSETIEAKDWNNEEDHPKVEGDACNKDSTSSQVADDLCTREEEAERDCREVTLESEGSCQESLSQKSVQDDVIVIEEKRRTKHEEQPQLAKDGVLMKRGEPSTRTELQQKHRKRQRACPAGGGRRLTRSCSRGVGS